MVQGSSLSLAEPHHDCMVSVHVPFFFDAQNGDLSLRIVSVWILYRSYAWLGQALMDHSDDFLRSIVILPCFSCW